ncbi:hypothetical protein NQ318_022378 [Aromia moschata]|uniref:Mediator of RNA polymerase II transcription subunit 1 n=1 Tax=Aromia moschata TaxID=1265417 RepID=A0AAV8Z511_9CUCU|nr:hypothetical protein NQ318_022378 [Aromia moschata]
MTRALVVALLIDFDGALVYLNRIPYGMFEEAQKKAATKGMQVASSLNYTAHRNVPLPCRNVSLSRSKTTTAMSRLQNSKSGLSRNLNVVDVLLPHFRLISGALTLPVSSKDKTKDWQLEILMEKLRSKAAQYKTLPEISKNVRMTLLEKRYALDSVEKSQHQKCLDTLQHSIKVTSLQSMVERLESLTRQLGLKFVVEPSGVFISSDMFYLEIVLESTGSVKDVKIHHEGKMEQQSCTELVNCLSRGDFADFTAQLEGFASVYQLNAEKKVKCKAFTALESLEADLSTLAQLQMFMKEPFNLIHKSPVEEAGGHPMRLTYFVSPYDLINIEKNDLEPVSVEMVVGKSLGYSVTVCMEGSAAHKLQTISLITINRNINGKSTPSYSPLTAQNSAVIPACFVLKLNKPMPMCLSLVRQIQQIHPWTDIDSAPTQPLLNLIVSHASDGKMDSSNNRGLFVTLPDQNHCYFMTENKCMDGVLVTSIPFTHPAHVANILKILREQALFNTIISSCVRPNSRQDFDNMTMFEVSALSSTHISISLEHPIEESMATAEVDLSDISNLVCRIHNPGTPPPANTPDTASELATKILNKCFSLPVTLRAIIKLWEKQSMRRTTYGGHENFSLPLGSGDPGGHKGPPGANLTEFGGLNDKIKQEPSGNAPHGMMMQGNQGMFLNESMIASNFQNFPPSDGVLTNMELTNILSDTAERSSGKRQKRKSNDDPWKSGKRKVGAEDSEMMESSSCDSTSRSTPLSQETEIRTPNSALGFPPDLELSTLDPAEILGVGDKSNTEFDNLDELGEADDVSVKEHKTKAREKSPPEEEKSVATPNISITPVPSSPSPGYAACNAQEKRPGIEIIPVPQSAASMLPSTITIMPISSGQSKSEEKSKERRSGKSGKDEKSRTEKRKKRKRDESPMGPPEKVPPKQDPLNKPVTVSIKPAESPPSNPVTPTSPSMMRKFSVSPTPNRSMSLSGKLSPSLMKSGLKPGSSSHQSPKHSPAHVPSSPKHVVAGVSSPKHHGTSPKHPSAGGSGKPSMSTLKSAASSPSSKGGGGDSKSKSGSKSESSRDKEKKQLFSVGSNSKTKSSSVKVKPLDLNAVEGVAQDGLPSPGGPGDASKSSQARNRKGSLSAIVDKLKVNAQHCDTATDLSGGGKSGGGRERSGAGAGKSGESKGGGAKIGETKNSEYMVKPSSDGMKITINKTRSKDSGSNKSLGSTALSKSAGTGSPKTHTGLKPGVNSGPASKKPQQLQKSGAGVPNSSNYVMKSGSNSSAKTSSSSGAKVSSGLSKSVSKLAGSPKSATDLSRAKDRLKQGKAPEKSIFSSLKDRKSSPTPNRGDDAESAYKLTQSNLSNLMMEGMMKQLDKNFQIPKLSARSADDKKNQKNDAANNVNRGAVDAKIFDMMAKNDLPTAKYPLAVPTAKMFDGVVEPKLRNNVNSVNPMALGSSPKLRDDDEDKKKEAVQGLAGTQGKEDGYKLDSTFASKSGGASEPLSLSTKSIDLTSKFVAPAPKEAKKGDGDALDFSGKSGPQPFPQSPSVSVHIVKSPAPSPLINPSPHSASPCITDDELMDEALIGLGK